MRDPHFCSAPEDPMKCYFLVEAEGTDQGRVAENSV